MDDEELLIFINRSTYRVNILKAIGHEYKIPSVIARDAGILLNHISYQLSTLGKLGLVVCINPEYRKGRLYKLTDKALNILDQVEYDPKLRKRKKDDDEEDSKDSSKKPKKKKSRKSAKSYAKKTTNFSSRKSKKNSDSPSAGE